jgi:hypothetical protein
MRKRGIIILAVIGAILFAVVADETVGKGFSWHDMDWSGDGHTSLNEVFHTFDVDFRRVQVDGKLCRSVYLLKDGMPVKLLCP